MADVQFDGWRVLQVAAWVITAIAAVILAPLKWIVQRAVSQLETHTKQLDVLEKTAVTRAELAAALLEMRTDHEKANAQLRADRVVMHQENVAHLVRIEDKMEENAGRDANARHDMRNVVN